MHIAIEHPDQPEVRALIDELDAYQGALYPPESNHFLDIATLSQPHVLFAVARGRDGAAMGCAALVLHAGYAELKRLFVRPQRRGGGVGKALLAFLEAQAARRGCAQLMLETGVSQPEALALYERTGWRRRGRFGDYPDDPLSVFMQKRVDASGGMPHRVFVFGTLKDGFPNFHVNQGVRVPGEFVTVTPYPLYLVGERCSPWMIDSPGQGHAVAGQVFGVDAPALAMMDRLERVGEADGYVRASIEVRRRDAGPAAPERVFVYLKPLSQFDAAQARHGPLAEYGPEHAALYRARI